MVVSAGIGVASPLFYREIINNGILKGDAGLVIRLAVLVGILGVLDALLGMVQAYLSSRIGASIVLSLRTRLFEHVQRMPLAFFTRVASRHQRSPA